MKPSSQFLKNVTREAGSIILEYFGKTGVEYTKKTDLDVVTQADLASEHYLKEQIKQKYPSHGIISEESDEYGEDAAYTWIIDPVDGTANYVNHLPVFAVMVGVMKDDEMLMSCIYFPVVDELFYAERGEGAFLNGERIRCSEQKQLDESKVVLVSFHTPLLRHVFSKISSSQKDMNILIWSLVCSAAAFSQVSCGRADVHVAANGNIWDIAPGILLCEEAGCEVSFLDGSPYEPGKEGVLIVSNSSLREDVLSLV